MNDGREWKTSRSSTWQSSATAALSQAHFISSALATPWSRPRRNTSSKGRRVTSRERLDNTDRLCPLFASCAQWVTLPVLRPHISQHGTHYCVTLSWSVGSSRSRPSSPGRRPSAVRPSSRFSSLLQLAPPLKEPTCSIRQPSLLTCRTPAPHLDARLIVM